MTEEKKYYTPSPEEFHVNFEFEYDTGDGWIEHSFPGLYALDGTYGEWIYMLEDLLQENKIRVKHLCREDIVSVFREIGWKIDDDPYYDLSSYAAEFVKSCEVTATAHKDEGDIFEVMVWKKNEGRWTVEVNEYLRMVDIDIRNKSEFRRILKQVGIK